MTWSAASSRQPRFFVTFCKPAAIGGRTTTHSYQNYGSVIAIRSLPVLVPSKKPRRAPVTGWRLSKHTFSHEKRSESFFSLAWFLGIHLGPNGIWLATLISKAFRVRIFYVYGRSMGTLTAFVQFWQNQQFANFAASTTKNKRKNTKQKHQNK